MRFKNFSDVDQNIILKHAIGQATPRGSSIQSYTNAFESNRVYQSDKKMASKFSSKRSSHNLGKIDQACGADLRFDSQTFGSGMDLAGNLQDAS